MKNYARLINSKLQTNRDLGFLYLKVTGTGKCKTVLMVKKIIMTIILTQQLIASTILCLLGGTLAMTQLQKQHVHLISLLENLNLDLK